MRCLAYSSVVPLISQRSTASLPRAANEPADFARPCRRWGALGGGVQKVGAERHATGVWARAAGGGVCLPPPAWLKVAGQLAFAKKASSPCPVLPAKVASLRMSVQ
jgi:hypothetical protein